MSEAHIEHSDDEEVGAALGVNLSSAVFLRGSWTSGEAVARGPVEKPWLVDQWRSSKSWSPAASPHCWSPCPEERDRTCSQQEWSVFRRTFEDLPELSHGMIVPAAGLSRFNGDFSSRIYLSLWVFGFLV